MVTFDYVLVPRLVDLLIFGILQVTDPRRDIKTGAIHDHTHTSISHCKLFPASISMSSIHHIHEKTPNQPKTPVPNHPNAAPITTTKSNQPPRNPPNKPHRWLKDQHMEMLNRPHALQLPPIPEPHNIPLPTHLREILPHEPLNLSPARGQQIIGQRIRRKREFRPDDEVHDPRVEAVGPVVAEDLPVLYNSLAGLLAIEGFEDTVEVDGLDCSTFTPKPPLNLSFQASPAQPLL
jgi:hypothetical protein